MKKVLKIGSAFIGIIIGAGFASGQEILQYFTSFGYEGLLAVFVATLLFSYLGMILMKLGSQMQTTSHREVIYKISGRYLGKVVDAIVIFTLFGVGVVMIAGAGSILKQQFGLPTFLGSLLLTILIIITVMLNVHKVIAVIGSITPFLIISVILIGIYSILSMDLSFTELNPIAKEQPSALPHWFISAVNYVSFNIALGAAMVLVMGGAEKDEKIASLGGLVGGIGLGLLILLSYFALFAKITEVANVDMPMLEIVNNVSPKLAIFMSIILFGMIFNTAVSMFYAFVARFTEMNTTKANVFIVITGLIAFGLSFAGFTKLVTWFYPFIGFLGLFLVVTLIVTPFRMRKKKKVSAA